MNKSAETVLMFNETLIGVVIRFIRKNPRSHSLEEIGMEFKAYNIKRNSFSVHICLFENVFATYTNHFSFV